MLFLQKSRLLAKNSEGEGSEESDIITDFNFFTYYVNKADYFLSLKR